MNENKEKKQNNKSPGIDFKSATKEEIILFVRDNLKPIEIRKILYPEFQRAAEPIQDKEELVQLVKQTFLKVRALGKKEKLEQKKVSISAEKESVTENNSNNSLMEEKINSNLNENVDVVDKRERVFRRSSSSSPDIWTTSNLDNYSIITESLYVWKNIHAILKNPERIKDPFTINRLAKVIKHHRFIREIVDVHYVFTISEAKRKADEIGIKIAKQTISDVLSDLALDGFMKLKVVKRGRSRPAHIYYLSRLLDNFPERYYNYLKRYEEVVQISGQPEDKTEKMTEHYAGLSRAAAKARQIRTEETTAENKERIERHKELVQISGQLSKDPSHRDSFDVELYELTQKLPKEELETNLQNKNFREAYNKMLQQIGGMTKEEFDSILRLEELKRKRDRG